jgi:hypothetical protein
MAGGYKLYCHDEFNDMSVYPSDTYDFTTTLGVITHLPIPPFIPNNYSFDGWYSDPAYTDKVLVGNAFRTSTENKDTVVHIYAKWVEKESGVFSSMTSLANEIRELSGTTDKLSLGEMITNLDNANDEVDTQAELIAEITTALEGKAAGGGGAIPTYSGTIITPMMLGSGQRVFLYIDGNLVVKIIRYPLGYQEIPVTIAAGTLIIEVSTGTTSYEEVPLSDEEILSGNELYQYLQLGRFYRPTSDNFIWEINIW